MPAWIFCFEISKRRRREMFIVERRLCNENPKGWHISPLVIGVHGRIKEFPHFTILNVAFL
jgi:hypothetical protein